MIINHNVVDLSSYQSLNVYFLVTLGKVNRECAFPDAKLKEINKVIKNGCNTISTSSKECYCDTDLCNTNIARDSQEFEKYEEIAKSGTFSVLNINLDLLSLMSTMFIFLTKL